MADKKFVAREALFVGRFRAFNKGDIVPAGHVQKYGWQERVEEVSDKDQTRSGSGRPPQVQ